MIITEEEKQIQYYKKVAHIKKRNTYRIANDGSLEENWQRTYYDYLTYFEGKWYGCRNRNIASSEGALDSIKAMKFLFSITESHLWLYKNDRTTEYVSNTKELSEDTVCFFMVAREETLCVYVIDGSKYKTPLKLAIYKDEETENLLGMAIIALVRQHDPDAAKEMEEFWFTKQKKIWPEPNNRIVACSYPDAYDNEELNLPWD